MTFSSPLFVSIILVDQTNYSIGSIGDGSNLSGYLVTAKRVLKDEQGNDLKRVYVRMNSKEGDPVFAPLDLSGNGVSRVFAHTDRTVDMAVVPVAPDEKTIDFKMIFEDLLITKESLKEIKIGEGSDVFLRRFVHKFLRSAQELPHRSLSRRNMIPLIQCAARPMRRPAAIDVASSSARTNSRLRSAFSSPQATDGDRARPALIVARLHGRTQPGLFSSAPRGLASRDSWHS
jgi:hypothetical protein